MLVDRVPSPAAFKELRSYVAGGGRDLEFRIGPRIRHEAVLVERRSTRTIRVEVTGSQLEAVRLPDGGSSIYRTSSKINPTAYTGTVDWDAGLVRGTFASDIKRSAGASVPLALVLAAVAGVLIGLIQVYVGVVAFIVLAALFVGLSRINGSGKGFALQVAGDVWQMAVVIGSAEDDAPPDS